ncbi:MAG TPA: ABC transporter substrate-binding protein [Stellaceae bacterium]|nr:ABC transporter substrate-binding protein [Stellaceae bacterium]
MTAITRRRLVAGTTAMLAASALGMPFVRRARAATAISFRLDWTTYGAHAPFYLALQEKMFDKEGLAVTIGPGQGSGIVSQLLGRGNDQLAFVDFGTMVKAISEGVPVIAVQRLFANLLCVISHADAPIKTPKDLEGKIIAFAPSESSGQMLPALMNKSGADVKKVSILTPAVGAKNALFLERRADAIPAQLNVQIAQLEAQGAKLYYFLYSDFGISLLNQGLAANVAWLKANGAAAKAFVAVSVEAHKAALADPEKAVDLLIKALPQQARNKQILLNQMEIARNNYVTPATKDKPFGYMAAADWDTTLDNLVQYGGLKQKVPLDKLYTNAYQME